MIMQFDTADLATMEANGSLVDVITHEMGHVLGFGTIWTDLNLLTGADKAKLISSVAKQTVQQLRLGIPVAELGRIFKRFYRIPGVMTTRIKGAGLGLFIVRAVVARHGGTDAGTTAGDEGHLACEVAHCLRSPERPNPKRRASHRALLASGHAASP